MTFPRRLEDTPAYGNYPGTSGHVNYAEGIFVGYRHYDKNGVEPLFPFGHGLSPYTTFACGNLCLRQENIPANGNVSVTLNVTIIYLRDVDASVERPVKELKRFAKVTLNPGETRTVNFELNRNDMVFYDVKTGDWVVEPGWFEVMIGSSSKDIRLTGAFTVGGQEQF